MKRYCFPLLFLFFTTISVVAVAWVVYQPDSKSLSTFGYLLAWFLGVGPCIGIMLMGESFYEDIVKLVIFTIIYGIVGFYGGWILMVFLLLPVLLGIAGNQLVRRACG